MGATKSKLKRNESTPTMAYGRLHIYESPGNRSRLAQAHARTPVITRGAFSSQRNHNNNDNSHTPLIRSFSADGLGLLRTLTTAPHHSHPHNTENNKESTPLLAGYPLRTTNYYDAPSALVNDDFEEEEDVPYDTTGPALSLWIVPALLCGLSYALYNIFIKLGSYSIHPVLGGVLLQFVAALLGLILLALQHVSQQHQQHQPPSSSISSFNNDKDNQENGQDNDNQQLLEYDRPGILWSICAGIAVGAAEMLSFFVSSRGVPAVHSIPVIIGGSVLFGTILGCALLQENLSPCGWCGVAMLVAGIVLVGTD
ncbi:EamA-like transporter [Fragilaria crotonensis]|nr:EamA-like transporter [Fragilaria crotonensis]